MVNEVAKNIYSIEVDLPENPLRWLNSYFISGGTDGRNLVIDTGFNRPECHEALLGGLKELNADFGRTDVFTLALRSLRQCRAFGESRLPRLYG